ncbi:MAG: nucleotidyltransferase domain-containing protein [Candidatus Omnitrophota bacterium]|nr:MAG: nucleotidyltransferase domain-containing protein [Candidatus Omnitrophota bacterium]
MGEQALYVTNKQKVLAFLLEHPDKKFYDREVSNLSGVSRAGTNFALRELYNEGLIKRERKGRMHFYYIDTKDALIKQLKITQNMIKFFPLLKKIKPFAIKVILYGSAAKGRNTEASDFDIFILTREPDKVKNILFKTPLREKIQYIVQTPDEYAKLKKTNPVFNKEISEGLILWEQK